nr:restriction endonuclease subunit S [Treponema saccharophilum]
MLTCKGTVGEMAFLKEKKVHIARQVMSIRSSEKISLGYVKIYLTTQIENLKSKAKSMIPGIAREDVISSLFPLPPLAEQKRIVAAIEKMMPLCEKLGV